MANIKAAVKEIKQKKEEANTKREQEELQQREQEHKEPAAAPAPQAANKDEPMLSSDDMQKIIAKRLNQVNGDMDKEDFAKQLADDFDADVKRRRTSK